MNVQVLLYAVVQGIAYLRADQQRKKLQANQAICDTRRHQELSQGRNLHQGQGGCKPLRRKRADIQSTVPCKSTPCRLASLLAYTDSLAFQEFVQALKKIPAQGGDCPKTRQSRCVLSAGASSGNHGNSANSKATDRHDARRVDRHGHRHGGGSGSAQHEGDACGSGNAVALEASGGHSQAARADRDQFALCQRMDSGKRGLRHCELA